MLPALEGIPKLEEAKFIAWRMSKIFNFDVPLDKIPVLDLNPILIKLKKDPFAIVLTYKELTDSKAHPETMA